MKIRTIIPKGSGEIVIFEDGKTFRKCKSVDMYIAEDMATGQRYDIYGHDDAKMDLYLKEMQ